MFRCSSHLVLFSLLALLFFARPWEESCGLCPAPLYAQESQSQPEEIEDKTRIAFEEKLEYYLNENTRYVIQELLDRERQLLDLIHNIHDEVALRGKSGMIRKEAGFDLVHGQADSMVDEYQQELDALVKIYDDLNYLKEIADYLGDVDKSLEVLDAKSQVMAAVESRELYKKGTYTPERVGAMVDEYTTELDSLLNIYDALEHLQVRAEAMNDSVAVASILEQKDRLFRAFSRWGRLGPLSEEEFNRYREELQRMHETVRELKQARKAELGEEATKLRTLEKNLVGNVDRTIYDLVVQAGYSLDAFPTVQEFIKAWKAERLLDIQARLAEYEIIWQRLLDSATPEERDRMFSSELSDALLNYSNGRYRTAEYQFQDILDRYGADYDGMMAVKYYIGEARWHRMAYEAARDQFLELLTDPTPSHYKVEALVRLMQYEQDFGTSAQFYQYYEQVVENKYMARGEIVNYAHYLAANRQFDNKQFSKAREILALIPETSEFYLPSQLLLATIYTNMSQFDEAIPIFIELSKVKNYPWTDLNVAEIRNTALLRLGLIYYQRGLYTSALETLEKISPGFEKHDEALMAQAWCKFRLNDLAGARDLAYELLKNHLASDYTYEALVLAAHCNRIMNRNESALDAYRYVVRAHGVMDVKRQFDKERMQIRDKVKELGRLETEALDKRQAEMYSEIARLRTELNEFLFKTQEKSDTGTQLLQDYYEERLDVVDRLVELDDIIDWARREGRPDVVKRAAWQRERLIKALETYQGDARVTNTAYLVDFPLAAKEASMVYRREAWGTVYRDMNLEKRRIERALEEIQQYHARLSATDHLGSRMDLEILQFDINNLRDRLDLIRKAMNETGVDEPKSDIDHWSDLSGFGMSDIVFKEREKRLQAIDEYADRLKIIEDIFHVRQQELMARIEQFEEDLKRIQNNLLSRKIQLEQLEKETYFNQYYFDTKEREEETWEDRLRQLDEK